MKPRKRFRIGPGGAVYLIVALLIYVVAYFSQANLLYWGFGLMIGGLAASVAIIWLMMGKLQVQRIVPSHGVVGEAMVLRYEVVNRRRWIPAFGLVIRETWPRRKRGGDATGASAQSASRARPAHAPFGWVLHLGANQSVQAEAPCWPRQRGYLSFATVVVSTSFPFGIVRRVVEFDLPGQVLVYPALWRIHRRILYRLSNIDPYGHKRQAQAGGHEEFFGMRQYRAGDSLKMVDWKRSARTGQLVSREMTRPSPPRMMIALDLSHRPPSAAPPAKRPRRRRRAADPQPPVDPVETAISLAASLVCDAYFHGYQIGLTVIGCAFEDTTIHHSLPHRRKLLESLALLDVEAPGNNRRSFAAEPTVIVRPAGDSSSDSARTMVLTADDVATIASRHAAGSAAILSPRRQRESRREQLAEAQTWT